MGRNHKGDVRTVRCLHVGGYCYLQFKRVGPHHYHISRTRPSVNQSVMWELGGNAMVKFTVERVPGRGDLCRVVGAPDEIVAAVMPLGSATHVEAVIDLMTAAFTALAELEDSIGD